MAVNSPQATLPAMGVTIYDDRMAFVTDAPGLPVEDWEAGHVLPGQATYCVPPVSSQSNDNCFLPGQVLKGFSYEDDPLGGSKLSVGLGGPGLFDLPSKYLFTNFPTDSTILRFSPAVNAVGLDISGNSAFDTVAITLFNNDGDIITTDTTVTGDVGTWTFWGVISPVPIARIDFTATSAEFIDNITFGMVVFPATATPTPTIIPLTTTPTSTITPDTVTSTPTQAPATGTPTSTFTPTYTSTPSTATASPTLTVTTTITPIIYYLPVVRRR
jgi:hypothetical protein